MKNIPVLYEEKKKPRNIMLTDTAWFNAVIKAKELGISVSEYVEKFLRNDGK